jgi:hypothetical protein
MTIIRVVRHRRGIVEFWIPEGFEGSTLKLVRWPIQDEAKQEYDEVLAARREQFAGMFTIIGEGSVEEYKERYVAELISGLAKETGWSPEKRAIHPWIKQVHLYGWEVAENIKEDGIPNYIAGFDQHDGNFIATGPVLRWGPNMEWALTPDGVFWLEAP